MGIRGRWDTLVVKIDTQKVGSDVVEWDVRGLLPKVLGLGGFVFVC